MENLQREYFFQMIPVYGGARAVKNILTGRPSICTEFNRMGQEVGIAYGIYHGFAANEFAHVVARGLEALLRTF